MSNDTVYHNHELAEDLGKPSVETEVAKTLKDIHELEDLLRESVQALKLGLMHKSSEFNTYGEWLGFMSRITTSKEEFNTMTFYGRPDFFSGRHV